MSGENYWGRKTFCVLTGASQGIGRRMAIELSSVLGAGSRLLLLARSKEGLEETARLAEAHANEKKPGLQVQIITKSVDLSTADSETLTNILSESLQGCQPSDYSLALIIHNAGSLGKVGQLASEMDDITEWQRYMDLNLSSAILLNTVFLREFPQSSGVNVSVVNTTSLCAIQPYRSMGYYCVGKAAREMFFRVLAEEEPWLDVLSYSPGPVETDMTDIIIANTKDDNVRQIFIDMKKNKTIVTCEQTTAKFLEVLGGKKYKSGQRVDYYDEL